MTPLVLVGSLSFPPGAFDTWAAQPLSESFEDWPDVAPIFRGESPGVHGTVRDVLSALGALDGQPAFFELGNDLAGLLLPDHTTILSQDLATALRQAASVGAKGTVSFLVLTDQVALTFDVGAPVADAADDEEEDGEPPPGAPRWVPGQSLFADESAAAAWVDVLDYVNAAQRDPSITRTDYRAKQETLGLAPLAEQPSHQALLAKVGAVVPAAHAAMLEAKVIDARGRPLAERYPTPESLTKALADAEPSARAAAIELFALVDGKAALPLAIELVSDASPAVRRHAVSALGRIPTAAAFDALLAVDVPLLAASDPRFETAVREAVKNSEFSGADARAIALLDGEALKPSTWTKLHRVTDAAARGAMAARAVHAIALVAQRPGSNPVPKLFALFDSHPAEEVHIAAAQALAQLRTADVQARAEAINLALMGMGRALNQDDARRFELLKMNRKDDEGGIIRFEDLDVKTLETLLDEHFIHPNARQNEAPSTAEFLQMMREHPEIRASGYAVSQKRADYRVHIEAIDCDLTLVPAERKDAVRELFEQLAESANQADIEEDEMHIWWTLAADARTTLLAPRPRARRVPRQLFTGVARGGRWDGWRVGAGRNRRLAVIGRRRWLVWRFPRLRWRRSTFVRQLACMAPWSLARARVS